MPSALRLGAPSQHLNNCKQLTRVLIVAPNLRLLHIGGCKSMVNVSLRCAHLTQLLANLCFRWVTAGLRHALGGTLMDCKITIRSLVGVHMLHYVNMMCSGRVLDSS